MSPNSLKASVRVATLLLGVGVGLLFGPDWVGDAIRAAVFDATAPALSLTRIVSERADRWQELMAGLSNEPWENPELQQEIGSLQHRVNQLMLTNLELQKRLDNFGRAHGSPIVAGRGEPLVIPELIEAAVLGAESADSWRSGRLLDRGSAHGIKESEWVLRDDKPLIDQGEDGGLEAGQPVYSGRAIVGRIARVGHWTSTVQPITDPEFRGHAQLIHESGGGVSLGAAGILHGTGDELCQLKFIDSEAAVSRGDSVYTGAADGLMPFPMYYGSVEKAVLKPGAPYWEISVRPGAVAEDLLSVQVLRQVINPERTDETRTGPAVADRDDKKTTR